MMKGKLGARKRNDLTTEGAWLSYIPTLLNMGIYSQTELLLQNCCQKNVTHAQYDINKRLRGVKVGILVFLRSIYGSSVKWIDLYIY